MKKIENELESNQINSHEITEDTHSKLSSSSNTTNSTSSSHSRKRKFTNKDESEDEKKEKVLKRYKSLMMVNKNPWILKNQTRVMEKITEFFEKDSY